MIDKTDYTSMRLTTLTALILPCINYVSLVTLELLDLLKKNGYFTVRVTVLGGGGGSVTSALALSKCENFDPFFSMECDSMILKTTFYFIVRGQNALLYH